jgi:hypothetical protein
VDISQSKVFAPPLAVARVMHGYPHRWWFAGGWAIDLFVGRVTRGHAVIEIGLFRDDQAALRAHLTACGWTCTRCSEGTWYPWQLDERIAPPEFQIIAAKPDFEPHEIDFFLDDRADGRWICRRHPVITIPLNAFTCGRRRRIGRSKTPTRGPSPRGRISRRWPPCSRGQFSLRPVIGGRRWNGSRRASIGRQSHFYPRA